MDKPESANAPTHQRKHETKEEFVKRCFTYKECQLFFPIVTDESETFKCGCGELELHHYDENDTACAEEWSPSLISNLGPTNAYGVLDFYRRVQPLNKSAEYVRISDDDTPKHIIKLMDKYWQIFDAHVPELCISVLSDLDSVHLDNKQTASFERGLANAIRSTKTIITTHGLNAGITPIVGKAVSAVEDSQKRPHCIGISPWGYVRSHYNLVRSEYSDVKSPVEYGTSDVVNLNEPISLNEEHTKFVLIDNGMRNTYHLSDVSKYRDEFESLMKTSSKEGGCGIPVITIVYGGGFDVVESVARRVVNGMPIVICESTGGAADILQRILHFKKLDPSLEGFSESQTTELKLSLEKLITKCGKDKLSHWTADYGMKLLRSVVNSEDSIKCVNLNEECGYSSLDEAITSTLIDSTIDVIFEIVEGNYKSDHVHN